MANPHQRTDDWYRAHIGKITSSRVRTITNGSPKGWLRLIDTMRDEIESGEYHRVFDDEDLPAPMEHGIQMEDAARANAELELGVTLPQVGFVKHPTISYLGCSPDFVSKKLRVNGEIKCFFSSAKHMEVFMNRQIPSLYYPQVQFQMECTRMPKTLFVSYHEDTPHWKQRTAIVEVVRNDVYIKQMLEKCAQFMKLLEKGGSLPSPTATKIKQYF